MKISENIGEELSGQTATVEAEWPLHTSPIAPWWHTALLVAFLLTVSVLTSIQSKSRSFGGAHVHRYLLTIAWEWVLALIAWWGIRLRRIPLREVLGKSRSGWKMWADDIGAAMIFWFMATLLLAAIATLLRLMHLTTLQKAVLEMAPQNGLEIALWVLLCVTAGVVEEFVFRGYLLQQFASFGSGATSRIWIGIILSSLIFGAAHGYEGAGGMIAITAYGLMFCILAIRRRALRTGMIAHAWHDAFTGILIVIAKHLHAF